MKKILLTGFIIFCIFQMIVLATAIHIGSEAINRANYQEIAYTRVDKLGAADGTGKITQVEIFAYSEMSGVEVATFSASENNLTTRDYETIQIAGQDLGVVPVGHQVATVDLDVVEGDYIGIHGTAGEIDWSVVGTTQRWYKLGDYIPCTSKAFTLATNRVMSLYGTGATEEEPPVEGNAIMFGMNF